MPFFSVPSVADQTSFNFTRDGFRDGRLCDSGRLRVEASFPPEVPFIPSGNSILFLRRFHSFHPEIPLFSSGGNEGSAGTHFQNHPQEIGKALLALSYNHDLSTI